MASGKTRFDPLWWGIFIHVFVWMNRDRPTALEEAVEIDPRQEVEILSPCPPNRQKLAFLVNSHDLLNMGDLMFNVWCTLSLLAFILLIVFRDLM